MAALSRLSNSVSGLRISKGERYQIKSITLKPMAKVSVHIHHHRAEPWLEVSGIAEVLTAIKSFCLLRTNQTTSTSLKR